MTMGPLPIFARASRALRLGCVLGLSLLAGATAAAGDAIRSPADWQGIWRGQYVCNQGVTLLTLTIRLEHPDTLRATFAFRAHPDNPGVPSGEYSMVGKVGPNAGHLKLAAQSWITRPRDYVTVDLEGDYDVKSGRYRGTVAGPRCSSFYVERDLIS
jgi:hypothetical protein